jgi:phage baseplate assembly protein gpV
MGVSYESVCLPDTIHENMVAFWVKDGTAYHHDFKTKKITFSTPSSITLKAPKIVLDAEVEITKNLKVTGSITDKKGDLTGHKHSVVNHNLAKPRP